MNVRIQIWPAVLEAYLQTFEKFKSFLPVIWLSLVLILIWDGVFWFYPNIVTSFAEAGYASSFKNFAHDFIFILVEVLIASIVFVALLRWLIIDEIPKTSEVSYQKGIPNLKTVFRLPYYFYFGPKEFLYASFVGLVTFLVMILENSVQMSFYHFGLELGAVYSNMQLYFYILAFRFVQLLELLLYAVFILVFAHIAVKGRVDIYQCVKNIKGNVLRVLIIGFLIFVPYYIINNILIIFSPFNPEWLNGWISNNARVYEFLTNAHHFSAVLAYYFCAIVDIVFISLIYRKLMVEHE